MSTYWVRIPIAGTVGYEVEADDESAAKARAWTAFDAGAEGEVTWEAYEQIVSGNVFHAEQNEVAVVLLERT